MYDASGVKFEVVDDILWREYNKIIIPVGPAKMDYTINIESKKFLLSKLPSALLVRATDGFRNVNTETIEDRWYAVVCDKFNDINELSAKNRNEINRGLRNCKVERIEANFLANNGLDVYISALKKRGGLGKYIIREKDFKDKILKTKDFDDIVHYYGVFYDNRLVGYSENHVYENIEVNYSTIKIGPNFLNYYPSYALIYEMNKFYLQKEKFQYVHGGFRNILHKTNMQRYLIEKFKFRKAYTNLDILYKPYLSAFLSTTFPAKEVMGRLNPRLRALYELERINRIPKI